MEQLKRMMDQLSGDSIHGKSLMDEMNELGKLRTAIMMERCSRRTEAIVCPKPRRLNIRSVGEESNELRAAADLSNILIGMGSPPYYSGSPPVRSSNPVIHDPHFHEQRTFQLPAMGSKRSTRKHFLNGLMPALRRRN